MPGYSWSSYVREGSTVNLRGMMLFGNVATTGSVVFVVSGSKLRTYQVMFLQGFEAT